MRENKSETITVPPKIQKLERMQTIEKEHKDALDRAVSLNIPHAVSTADEPINVKDAEREPAVADQGDTQNATSESSPRGTDWDEVVEKLYQRTESGNLILNKESNTPLIQ